MRALIAVASAAALAVLGVRAIMYLRTPPLGLLEARPAEPRLSVRVGDRVEFAASAPGAVETVWSLWGRRVASGPVWSYDPRPEDAGWQQVTVEVRGGRGDRAARTWDIGVDAVGVPEIASLDPPAGPLALEAGARARLRARARVAAARSSDRLAFEWSMDDRPLLRDEQPAIDGTSEVVLPPLDAGSHRLRLRVTEDGRTASIADWAIDARPGEPPPPEGLAQSSASEVALATPVPPAAPEPPSPAAVAPAPVAAPPAPHLVRVPDGARLEASLGVPLMLEARLEPEVRPVSHRWVIDGRTARARGPRLEWTPRRTGGHRISVAAVSGRHVVATDGWIVLVRAPEPTVAAPEPVARVDVVRVPETDEVDADVGDDVSLEARIETPDPRFAFHWSVDGRPVPRARASRFVYAAARRGRHRVVVSVEGDGRVLGRAAWRVLVRGAEPVPTADDRALPAARVEESATEPTVQPLAVASPKIPERPAGLVEADVRQWLAEYARAWSRKDVAALRRMGQVHSPAEADQLDRYFRSIGALDVDVRVLSLTIDGPGATVEFERIDTVTDPGGRRQELRLPPMRKRIERTPDGLRFADATGAG